MLLEEGALQAAQGKPEAVATFQKFIRDFPQSPRVSKHGWRWRSWRFTNPRPNLEAARKDLALARQNNPTARPRSARIICKIWLADAASSEEAPVIEAATSFLDRHRDSGFSADVRMKLAEAYYRRGDFANAQTQFELLVQEKPDAPLAEKALFLGARRYVKHGSGLFRSCAFIARPGGEVEWGIEMGGAERGSGNRTAPGKNREALALYDEVLKNDAKPAERREAICGKGDIYYELGATDPQNYREAITLYERLANDPGCRHIGATRPNSRKAKRLNR